jgi:hypothetical protein
MRLVMCVVMMMVVAVAVAKQLIATTRSCAFIVESSNVMFTCRTLALFRNQQQGHNYHRNRL